MEQEVLLELVEVLPKAEPPAKSAATGSRKLARVREPTHEEQIAAAEAEERRLQKAAARAEVTYEKAMATTEQKGKVVVRMSNQYVACPCKTKAEQKQSRALKGCMDSAESAYDAAVEAEHLSMGQRWGCSGRS